MSNKVSHPFTIPATVPRAKQELYTERLLRITKGTGNLLLFACDQKIEHLNRDFLGPGIAPEDNDPAHLFSIASQPTIGAFATHLGLIAQYAQQYPSIPYIVKMNGKTDIIPKEARDPLSRQLWHIDQILTLQEEYSITITGIGYTLYLGSEYESQMLNEAAQLIYTAHQYGLIAVLWIYPRGKYVTQELHAQMIMGAAGVGASLGADFIKLNAPVPSDGLSTLEILRLAAQAAGRSRLIISGGPLKPYKVCLEEYYQYLQQGIAGCAIGRNLHQRSLDEAIAFSRALAGIVYETMTPSQALVFLKKLS
jgi:DhnA family fructose-bisphosphate aldolase class Ia